MVEQEQTSARRRFYRLIRSQNVYSCYNKFITVCYIKTNTNGSIKTHDEIRDMFPIKKYGL